MGCFGVGHYVDLLYLRRKLLFASSSIKIKRGFLENNCDFFSGFGGEIFLKNFIGDYLNVLLKVGFDILVDFLKNLFLGLSFNNLFKGSYFFF